MQRFTFLAGLALLAAAPLASAVPDANGVVSEPAPDISSDAAMSARLNYNVGFERFESARRLELTAAELKGAALREHEGAVRRGLREAREKFQAAVAADPAMKEAWNLLGYTSRRLGDYETSLAAYDRALALAPDYPEAIEYRAELFLLTGKFEQVQVAYAQLLQSSPSYAGVLKDSMRGWLAMKNAPGSAQPGRDAFAAWVSSL